VRFVFRLLLMCVIALGVGFGLSYYALTDGRMFTVSQLGPWTAWPDVGAPNPNPYTRAHLTREAALQLGQAEGLHLVASVDSAGEPLSRNCTYRLEGRTPQATFWTLVATDPAGVNVAVPDGPLALRSTGIVRENDGSLRIHVGTRLAPGNWLELAGEGPFTLGLTLYDTAVFTGFGATGDTMPAIVREACA
jgi:hypothetical protein